MEERVAKLKAKVQRDSTTKAAVKTANKSSAVKQPAAQESCPSVAEPERQPVSTRSAITRDRGETKEK